MSTETFILVVGLALNIVATVGGYVGMLIKFEHRLTRLETHLLHVMPKRRNDRVTP